MCIRDRFKNLLEELVRDGSSILFVDEFHTIVGAGAAEGAIDAASICLLYTSLDLCSKIENGKLRVDQGVIAGCAGVGLSLIHI